MRSEFILYLKDVKVKKEKTCESQNADERKLQFKSQELS